GGWESGRAGEASGNRSSPRPLPLSLPPACLRLGLRVLSGIPEAAGRKIEKAREVEQFKSLYDFVTRTGLSQAVVARLAEADAFSSLAIDRRKALWQALGQERKARHMPLLAGLANDEP